MQVTFDHAYVEAFDLSADGKRLAVQSDRDGYIDIWVLPATGGEMQPITRDADVDWWPAWSYDGQFVAYYSNRGGGDRETWIQPVAGGVARAVTQGGGLFPHWAPDGQSLFVGTGRIERIPLSGGEPQIVVTGSPAKQVGAMEFSLSPDGRDFAYAAGRLPDRRLWRAPIEGGDGRPLTKGQAAAPAWSPDGRWVYFHTFRESGGTTYQLERPGLNIWRVSADGTREEPVTRFTARRGLLGHSIDTDGQRVYFTWREDVSDIWTMEVQSGGR